MIRRVVKSGGVVHVVWMTSGDGFPEGVETADGINHPTSQDYRGYGKLREGEARAAVGILGVKRGSLSMLGFPDGGLCELASTYLSAKARAFESPFTERISPPLSEQVIRGVRYRGTDARRELERLLVGFAPTVVATVHPEDEHPDHCSTHIFMREALAGSAAQTRTRPRVLQYLIHYDTWPLRVDAGAGSVLYPPADSPPAEGRWASLTLTSAEIVAKKEALLRYHSQTLVIGRLCRRLPAAMSCFWRASLRRCQSAGARMA